MNIEWYCDKVWVLTGHCAWKEGIEGTCIVSFALDCSWVLAPVQELTNILKYGAESWFLGSSASKETLDFECRTLLVKDMDNTFCQIKSSFRVSSRWHYVSPNYQLDLITLRYQNMICVSSYISLLAVPIIFLAHVIQISNIHSHLFQAGKNWA